jgi:hypothetical protein
LDGSKVTINSMPEYQNDLIFMEPK